MTERDDSARRAGKSAGLSDSGVESDTQTEGAEVFDGHSYTYPDSFCECAAYVGGYADWRAHMAETLLASDWLAAREAAAEVRGAQAALYEAADDLRQGRLGIDFAEAADELDARAAAAAAGGGGEA